MNQVLGLLRVLIIAVMGSLITMSVSWAYTEVGDILPHDLVVNDQFNKQRSFDDLKGSNGTVLVFVRSAEWCPYCQRQLIEINKAEEEIKSLGYSVVSISYDRVDQLAAFNRKAGINYPMLSDKGSAIIKSFGILNKEVEPNTFAYGIPDPAVYIIGAEKVVQARLAEESFKKRPPASLIVQTIKSF